MVLLAAFKTLLYRYTGQEDILIGSPIANRNQREISGLIGCFINTLVLRTDLSQNPTFNELLGRIRSVVLGAFAHQDLPFEKLVEELQPERDLSRSPLFQVMFVFQNAPTSSLELTGLTLSPLPVENKTAKFNLTLSLEQTTQGMMAIWEYNTDLLDGSTIERMARHFQILLEGIVAYPQQHICKLPLLTPTGQPDTNPIALVTAENLIYVLYTSGSTGKPNPVAIKHRQLLNYYYGILEKLNLPTGASFATISTFAADLGNTVIFPSLCTGGCLHIISYECATHPAALANYCHNHPIDCLKIVPTHLAALLTGTQPEKILPRQCLILGGEAATWELIEQIRQSTECRIFNHYGPTEATVGVLTYPVQMRDGKSALVPLGRPLSNCQIYLLDRYRQPTPLGVQGEIYIGGDSVAKGYLNQTALTAERFIPNPFIDEPLTRIYKTGDLARYLYNGNI